MSQELRQAIILSVDLYNKALLSTYIPSENHLTITLALFMIMATSLIYWINPCANFKVVFGSSLFIGLLFLSTGYTPICLTSIRPLDIYTEPSRTAIYWRNYGARPIDISPLFNKDNILFFETLYNVSLSAGLTGTALNNKVVYDVITALRLLDIKNGIITQ